MPDLAPKIEVKKSSLAPSSIVFFGGNYLGSKLVEKLLEKGHIHTHIDAQKGQSPHWSLEFSHLHLGNLNFSLSLEGSISKHDNHNSHDSHPTPNLSIPHATVGIGLKIPINLGGSHH